MIFTIALLDLKRLIKTPIAWFMAGISQLITTLFLNYSAYGYSQYQDRLTEIDSGGIGVTSAVVAPVLSVFIFVAVFIVPLLSMRLIGEERSNHTITLLLSAPLSTSSLVLGKFFGVFVFCLLLYGTQIISIIFYIGTATSLNYAHVAVSGLCGILVIGLYCSIGLFCSTIFSSPLTIALASFGAIILLWLLGIDITITHEVTPASNFLEWLSIDSHTTEFTKGVLASKHIIYYFTMMGSFLFLSHQNLETNRISGMSA